MGVGEPLSVGVGGRLVGEAVLVRVGVLEGVEVKIGGVVFVAVGKAVAVPAVS